jgi:endonuclease YncB( thermonuclease family)
VQLVRYFIWAHLCVILAGHLVWVARAEALEVAGPADVIDGDTLAIAGQHIRLFGIDAPEAGQTCSATGGKPWPCGRVASEAMRRLTRSEPVRCEGHETDRYSRLVARCWLGSTDIAGAMVAKGLAWAFVRYTQSYVEAEAEARSSRVGIWQGRAEPPWEFRKHAGRRLTGGSEAPDPRCAIKGNISRTGKRIYHTPGQKDYGRTVIDTADGERWFCDEKEAAAAGWRKART